MADRCTRVVSAWLVVLDNVPTLALFILGAVLIWWLWWPFAVVYLAYCVLAIVLFWARICCYCSHYDTLGCPCGYGVIAARLFKYKGDRDFREVFRKNIAVVYPCWFVPLAPGAYLLYQGLDLTVLGVLVAFCIVGFVLIPAIAKLVGCRGCEMKDQCPWMGR